MKLNELSYFLEQISMDSDLDNPNIFIRIGDVQVPLLHIKIFYKNECIVLQDKNYEKDILI